MLASMSTVLITLHHHSSVFLLKLEISCQDYKLNMLTFL